MSEQFPAVTVPNTEVRTLQSTYVDQEYKLFISLPDGYHQSEESYPVLYVTDANWCFNIFTTHPFKWMPTPPMIIVGIGYPTDDDGSIANLRSRDFLATQDKKREQIINAEAGWASASGDGAAFLSFIREELFSFIDAQYRTKADDRTFYGLSWGGTFGIYTLFNQPETFQRYIISAPDLSWDDRICFSYESDYADGHTDLPVDLYLAVGSLDEDMIEHNFALLVEFHTTVQSRKYQGLNMKFDVHVDETHLSAAAPSASRGIRFVFG